MAQDRELPFKRRKGGHELVGALLQAELREREARLVLEAHEGGGVAVVVGLAGRGDVEPPHRAEYHGGAVRWDDGNLAAAVELGFESSGSCAPW